MAIDRKIWRGDVLNLAEGNSFYGRDEVVHHRSGSALVVEDSEVGDPLVSINGGYIVKRADLFELSQREVKFLTLTAHLSIPEALNGIDHTERAGMRAELEVLVGRETE